MENDQMNQPVTRAEFQNEIKKLATKEDLNKFATKDDLKKFATKKDFVKLAENTSKEIKRLNGKIDWLASKVMEIREYLDERFNLVLHKLDGIAGVLDVIRTKQVATNTAIMRIDVKNDNQDKKLKEHEHRIVKIESQLM